MDLEEIKESLRVVLNRCRELGVTVSQSKFHIGESVNFVGYKISADGIRSSDKNLESHTKLPSSHVCKGHTRVFRLGQSIDAFLSGINAEYSKHQAPVEERNRFCLGGKRSKRTSSRAKKILLSNTVVKPFIMSLRTELVTDASKLHVATLYAN